MLELEKFTQIIQAWLAYIRLEELTQAEVERGSDVYPKVVDKGVQLVGNKLMLDGEVFKQFQQQQQAAAKRGKPNDFQMAIAFPQIYLIQGKGKEQKLKYLPLFTVDISPIFKGNYRKTGWDLTEYEFQPVVVNLMRLYGLEEEQAESLIVASGILKFLEDTFKGRFATLRDFIDLVDLPDGRYKTFRQPYLLRCDFTPYNALLKLDLQGIQQQIQETPHPCNWLTETHPAMQYLFGKPRSLPPQVSPQHEIMFLGAFPSHTPDEYQASVLKHTQENLLTAVCGPPGTGKTEVFLHLVAQQVVNRALRLVRGEEDGNNLILFASTNNSAIQKFLSRLTDKFSTESPHEIPIKLSTELSTELPTEFSTEQFYLPGGNQSIIRRETLPKLQSRQDWLRNTEFNPDSWEQAKLKFIRAENEIQQLIEQNRFNKSQKAVDAEKRSQLDIEIQSLNNDIAANNSELQALTEERSRLGDYANFPISAYQQIKEGLSQAERELPKESDSIAKRAYNLINFTTDKLVFKRLANRTNAAVLNTLASSHPFQIPLDRLSLTTVQMEVQQKLDCLQQWQNLNQEVTNIQTKLTALNKQLELKLFSYQQIQKQIQNQLDNYPQDHWYSSFYRDHHPLQLSLFQHAWAFLHQEVLRRKDSVIRALETYGSILTGDGDALLKLETDADAIYRDLSLIFPVISSSLQSIRNMLPILQPNSVKLALVDEAGTTLVHQLFPLLVRSQRAVVAGDPQQIEPIVNLCDDTIKQYFKTAFLDMGMANEDYYRYAPTAKYTATAYHRAAGASGTESDLGNGIILRNHYRCTPPIIQFCSPNYPGGLQILSNYDETTTVKHLLAYHVEGSHLNHTNPEEIDAVETAIASLLQQGYDLGATDKSKTIGVMSPFSQQANALRYRLTNRWRNFSWDDIGTVHTFQGGEKAVIILSAYQCHKEHSFWFLNRKPNLLNTAVSRARELFVLVGNLRELELAGGETKRLVEHIRQHGEMQSASRTT
ncbi:DEAD/DEAH box helicase [Calothrix sp. PCC 6303]|uniref:DEAD/DEAH box helicase n=1 Tax=Calothrix sp. PCC 6303 TaxID=1170562 RepID=UPI0002A04C60|nr:AAA domain-containing protein [Calothrix sp. PCC 6303]AFZ04640.1 superfamily I DNA/RNA helicase [Calothrix sp. PCC 6303]